MSVNSRTNGLSARAGRPPLHPQAPREEVYNTQVVIMRLRRDGRRGRMIFFAVLGMIVAGVAILLTLHANRPAPSARAISMDSSLREFRPLQDLALPPPPQHTVVQLDETDSGPVTAPRPRKRHRVHARSLATASAPEDALFSGCEVAGSRPAPVLRATMAVLKYGR